MKNIHILPTENYSPLVHSTSRYGGFFKSEHYSPMKEMGDSYQHIYITSDEEIKDVRTHKGKWQLEKGNILNKFPNYLTDLSECKLVILTTDQDLIKDGVQAIDDEFLEWFVKNPSCEEIEIDFDVIVTRTKSLLQNQDGKTIAIPHRIHYRIIIPKEEPKQITSLDGDGLGGIPKGVLTMLIGKKEETLEEAAVFKSHHSEEDFIRGGRWQQERSYSEKEVLEILDHHTSYLETFIYQYIDRHDMEVNRDWFKQFKKK